jgi:uncharacterized protein YneF (UPF0154 family)
MKYKLTTKDIPKIALVLILLVGSIGTYVSRSHQAQLQQENSEMIKHMNREMGVVFEEKDPEEGHGQEENDRKELESAQRNPEPAQ